MGDLWLGCWIVATLAAGLFGACLRLFRRWSDPTCDGVAVIAAGGLFFYIYLLWFDLRLAQLLPFSALIVLGNWLPLFAAVLAALVWRRLEGQWWRKFALSGGLLLAAGYALVHPLLGEPPVCGNAWDRQGFCRQTTPNSCSPAAAATLLARHGIGASEREMAGLCLTRHGTSWQGLYRGLKLKAAAADLDVQVIQCAAAALPRYGGPLIVSVGLPGSARADGALTREFGWQPGVNHSVVLLGFQSDGSAEIADPSLVSCREVWSAETFATLWRGHAFRLAPRP